MKTVRLIAVAGALLLGANLSFVGRAQSASTKRIDPGTLVADLYRQHNRKHQVFYLLTKVPLKKHLNELMILLLPMEAASTGPPRLRNGSLSRTPTLPSW